MFRKFVGTYLSLAFAFSLATAADNPASRASLSAEQIVDKNVAARGGLQAWRAVQTMSLAGKLGAGGNQRATLPVPMSNQKSAGPIVPRRPVEEVQLPFVMELKRPHKMRFELQFNGKTAIQVYDGTNGWKLRPFLNRLEVEPYTADEVKISSMQSDLDGYLVDYAAKGTRVELVGNERVEDRNTYKIKMTMKSGEVLHVWIDAETFLEAKIEGQPKRLDGTDHPVEVYFRDFRNVDGLQVPFTMETRVLPVQKTATGLRDVPVPPERIIIDKVVLNPKFDDALFRKPEPGATSASLK